MAMMPTRTAKARQAGETLSDPLDSFSKERPIGPILLMARESLLLLHNFDWFPWYRISQFFLAGCLIGAGVLMMRNGLDRRSIGGYCSMSNQFDARAPSARFRGLDGSRVIITVGVLFLVDRCAAVISHSADLSGHSHRPGIISLAGRPRRLMVHISGAVPPTAAGAPGSLPTASPKSNLQVRTGAIGLHD